MHTYTHARTYAHACIHTETHTIFLFFLAKQSADVFSESDYNPSHCSSTIYSIMTEISLLRQIFWQGLTRTVHKHIYIHTKNALLEKGPEYFKLFSKMKSFTVYLIAAPFRLYKSFVFVLLFNLVSVFC